MIKIEKTSEVFAGIHKPIISKSLFDKVHDVFNGKNIKKQNRHFFVFRRLIRCQSCGNLLIPERQKGLIYYRCHTRNCQRSTLKEETIDKELLQNFKKLQLTDEEYLFLRQESVKENNNQLSEMETARKGFLLQQDHIKDRLSKLADAYVDGVFDKETYLEKKNALIFEEQAIKERFANFNSNNQEVLKRFDAFLELVNSVYLCYEQAKPEDRRHLVKTVTSNFTAEGKTVLVKLETPFEMVVERQSFTSGSPYREATRTLASLFKKLFIYFKNLDTSKSSDEFINYVTSKTEKKSINNFLKSNH